MLIQLVSESPARSLGASASGCIPVILGVLDCSTNSAGTLSCAACLVDALAATSGDIQVGFKDIGVLRPRVLQTIMAHVDDMVVSKAVSAFRCISNHPAHKTAAGEAISALPALLKDRPTPVIAIPAACTLKQLCCNHEGNIGRRLAAGAVPTVTNMLNTLTSTGKAGSTWAAFEVLYITAGSGSTSRVVASALAQINFPQLLEVDRHSLFWLGLTAGVLGSFSSLLRMCPTDGPNAISNCGGAEVLIQILGSYMNNSELVGMAVSFLLRLTPSHHPKAAAALSAKGIPALHRLLTSNHALGGRTVSSIEQL